MLNPAQTLRLNRLVTMYRSGAYTAHELIAAAVGLMTTEIPADVVEQLPAEAVPLLRDWAVGMAGLSEEEMASIVVDFGTSGTIARESPRLSREKAVALQEYFNHCNSV